MGDLVRFLNPERERAYSAAAENARQSIYACFYQMHRGGLKPSEICDEINFFMKLMETNIPAVKQNLWNWEQEENT